jgi:hypothetical protein
MQAGLDHPLHVDSLGPPETSTDLVPVRFHRRMVVDVAILTVVESVVYIVLAITVSPPLPLSPLALVVILVATSSYHPGYSVIHVKLIE